MVGMMVFPDLDACGPLCAGPHAGSPASAILGHKTVRERFQSLLESFVAESTGNSNRIARAILVDTPPSLDAGEVTDKGTLNQRAVLEHRADLVDQIYAIEPGVQILRIKGD
jgi:feruloyl-CoA synthase